VQSLWPSEPDSGRFGCPCASRFSPVHAARGAEWVRPPYEFSCIALQCASAGHVHAECRTWQSLARLEGAHAAALINSQQWGELLSLDPTLGKRLSQGPENPLVWRSFVEPMGKRLRTLWWSRTQWCGGQGWTGMDSGPSAADLDPKQSQR
jgi:hypothetical protein